MDYARRQRAKHNRLLTYAFSQNYKNKAAAAAWVYIETLVPFGAQPDEGIYTVAERAVFSTHALTKEEANIVTSFARSSAAAIDASLIGFDRFVFRYIRCMF